MKEKKVLIVAYYWPPSGGSGVQRWLKFVKYLAKSGWMPYVFTPEQPAFDIKDESLLKDVPAEVEVIRFPIWEPYELFFKISSWFGKKKSAKPTDVVDAGKTSWFQNVSTWVRGNFFLPDPRRFWVKPSVKFLLDFLKDSNIEIVITTGPPHSLHLIGLRLKEMNPSLKWIADFRDPWSQWGFLDTLKSSSFARKYHRNLEAKVLQIADEVLTITPFYARQFERLGKRPVQLLTNGFDEDDFSSMQYQKADHFLIRHVGIVNEKCDPRPFLSALESMISENKEFAGKVLLEFIGDVHPRIHEFVSSRAALQTRVLFTASMPHKKLISLYGSSSLLLLVLTGYKDAEGYLPGKLFEYIATGLPILGIGPEDGDAAQLLKETGGGRMLAHQKAGEIKSFISYHFDLWKKSETQIVNKTGSGLLSRRAITSRLSDLLLTLLEKRSPAQGL